MGCENGELFFPQSLGQKKLTEIRVFGAGTIKFIYVQPITSYEAFRRALLREALMDTLGTAANTNTNDGVQK